MNRLLLAVSFQFFVDNSALANMVWCRDSEGAFSFKNQVPGFRNSSEKATEFRVCSMLIVEGTTFDCSPVVIYPKNSDFTIFPGTKVGNLDSYIRHELANFLQDAPKAQSKYFETVKNKFGSFKVYKISNGPSPNEFEYVAYTFIKSQVFIVVMSARNESNLKKYYPTFKDILSEVSYLTYKDLYEMVSKFQKEDEAKKGYASFEKKYFQALAPQLAQALKKCIKSKRVSIFKSIIQVNQGGAITDVATVEGDEETRCIATALLGFKGEEPPWFPIHLGVKIKIED